jgi:hypothetical protein
MAVATSLSVLSTMMVDPAPASHPSSLRNLHIASANPVDFLFNQQTIVPFLLANNLLGRKLNEANDNFGRLWRQSWATLRARAFKLLSSRPDPIVLAQREALFGDHAPEFFVTVKNALSHSPRFKGFFFTATPWNVSGIPIENPSKMFAIQYHALIYELRIDERSYEPTKGYSYQIGFHPGFARVELAQAAAASGTAMEAIVDWQFTGADAFRYFALDGENNLVIVTRDEFAAELNHRAKTFHLGFRVIGESAASGRVRPIEIEKSPPPVEVLPEHATHQSSHRPRSFHSRFA